MNPGELNRRIKIQTLTSTVNVNGFAVENWTDLKTVWAKIQNLHGSEFFQAQQVNSKATCKFTIRYVKDLDTSMRIVYENKNYNILYVDDIRAEHTYIEMLAEVIDNA